MTVKNKNIYLLIILLVIVLIIPAGFILTLRHYISKFSNPAFISTLLSKKMGCPVIIEKISVTTTSKLLIEGLHINTPKNIKNPGEILSIKKTVIHFDPWELIKKRDIKTISKIEITGSHLTLTNYYIDWLKTRFKKNPKLPDKLPKILVSSGIATLKINGISVPLNNIKGEINPLKGKSSFNAKGVAGGISSPWKTSGFLSYNKGVISISDLSGTALNGNFTGKGTFTPENKNFNFSLKTNFNNLSFNTSGKIFPGLSGISGNTRGNLDLKRLGEKVTFFLQTYSDDLTVGNNRLPPVHAAMNIYENQILFHSLNFSDNATSLTLTGRSLYKQNWIRLTGFLNGQSIAGLNALFKKSSSDGNGNLYGTLLVEGNATNPTITYNGRINNLAYRGTVLGNGKLNISVYNEALQGRLTLDEPVKLFNLSFAISGTTKKPILTPLLSNTKIKIDPSGILNSLKRIIHF